MLCNVKQCTVHKTKSVILGLVELTMTMSVATADHLGLNMEFEVSTGCFSSSLRSNTSDSNLVSS